MRLIHVLALVAAWATAAAAQSVVDLGYVKYAGDLNALTGIVTYRGIPYAQPPLGNLRWRAPLPIELSKTYGGGQLVQAVQQAPFCFQSTPYSLFQNFASAGTTNAALVTSEDCLILNVLVPAKPQSKALPVIALLHGGGYTQGGPSVSPGDSFVYASEGGVIYVEIQYRLGLLGFLGGSGVASNGALNAGLLDQRLALEWIQRHIAAFGGDPRRVTIYGTSAGGGSVTLQLTAYGGQGARPFAAAIAEYPWWTPLLDATSQEIQYRNTLRASGCSNMACLRALAPEQIEYVNQRVQNISYPTRGLGFGLFYFGPVVDGNFVQALPDMSFKLGRFHKVPFLTDREEFEGYVFSNMLVASQTAETRDAEYLFPNAGPSFFRRLYQLYPLSDFISLFFQRQTWFGDFIIDCPTYQMATQMVRQSPTPTKVFKMHFTAGGGLHGATTAYLASRDVTLPLARNHTLAEIMVRYFVSFAVYHDPNPGRRAGAPLWPSYGRSFQVLRANEDDILTERDLDASARCDFFSSQGQSDSCLTSFESRR